MDSTLSSAPVKLSAAEASAHKLLAWAGCSLTNLCSGSVSIVDADKLPLLVVTYQNVGYKLTLDLTNLCERTGQTQLSPVAVAMAFLREAQTGFSGLKLNFTGKSDAFDLSTIPAITEADLFAACQINPPSPVKLKAYFHHNATFDFLGFYASDELAQKDAFPGLTAISATDLQQLIDNAESALSHIPRVRTA